MTNADQKAAIRERMARTGETYTAAKRAIAQERASRKAPGESRLVSLDDLLHPDPPDE
jgi:hypothetical protein